jgi:hypothetical protein
MTAEDDRTRLIGQIAGILREDSVPAEARDAGLTFIAWLARRMPGESPSTAGVAEMKHRAQLRDAGRAVARVLRAGLRGR